jgi:hypothetical protein
VYLEFDESEAAGYLGKREAAGYLGKREAAGYLGRREAHRYPYKRSAAESLEVDESNANLFWGKR